jgi:hypothetical protein
MANDGYYREKLSAAVDCLVGASDIRSRVLSAFVSMITVDPDGFSDKSMGERFRSLYARATARSEEIAGEGALKSTLRQMSDDEVTEIASEILSLHNDMLRAAPKGEL